MRDAVDSPIGTNTGNPVDGARPTVHVIDDDASVRTALARLLRSAQFSVSTYGSASDFLQVCDSIASGCMVLDIVMPEVDGLALQRTLSDRGCELPIVFLSGRADVPTSVRAMKCGACDVLTKPVDDMSLIDAVTQAIGRDRERRAQRVRRASTAARLATLTGREREVLMHVIEGRLNKQIAADLGTAEKTVKVHRARAMQKMCVRSVAELVRLIERAGAPRADRPD